MTPEALFEKISELADGVVSDERWQDRSDDLGVSVLGMLLYGYALAVGRMLMFLDIDDINHAVRRCLVERVGVANKWGEGLVEAAARSAFDQSYHPGQFELIGVGHQYLGEGNVATLVDNVFANLESVRRAAQG